MMTIIRTLFRWLVGATFIFSGFVKVIDPLGYGYKIADYLEAMHLSAIDGAALPLALILAVLELVIGFSLFFNQLPKLGALGALLMMVFFTPLTLWLAIANPVSDCGCFGDALVITNWQSFFKNLVLLAMAILLFAQRKKIKTHYHTGVQWIIMFVVGFASLGLGFYCLKTLPIIDFRPYHIGANIAEGMIVPEDAPKPVIESSFIYEKDGKQKEFSIDNLPDESWKFIDAKHIVIDPGYVPPIHDFTMTKPVVETAGMEVDLDGVELVYKNADGEQMFADVSSVPDASWKFDHYICEECEGDIDVSKIRITYSDAEGKPVVLGVDEAPEDLDFIEAAYEDEATETDIAPRVLADERYSFLMIALRLEDMETEHLAEFDSIAEFAAKNNMGFYCMTSSNAESIATFTAEHPVNYGFYNTDPITLKTIVRSNPGLLLIRKGTVIDKWHDGNLPEVSELKNELTGTMFTKQHNQRDRLLYVVWILGALLAMALIRNIYNWLIKNRYINDKNDTI